IPETVRASGVDPPKSTVISNGVVAGKIRESTTRIVESPASASTSNTEAGLTSTRPGLVPPVEIRLEPSVRNTPTGILIELGLDVCSKEEVETGVTIRQSGVKRVAAFKLNSAPSGSGDVFGIVGSQKNRASVSDGFSMNSIST